MRTIFSRSCWALAATVLTACNALPTPPAPVVTAATQDGGTLTVTVRHEAARRVQAVFTDVERMAVEVTAWGGYHRIQFLDKAAFTLGQASLTFTGVPTAGVTVNLKAYDAQDRLLGTAKQTAILTPGQPTTIPLSLQLEPTYTGSPSPGNLTVETGFVEVPVTGTLGATYPVSGGARFAIDADSNFWVLGSSLVKLSPTGTQLASVTLSNAVRRFLAVDSAGNVWLDDGARLTKYGPTGQLLTTVTTPTTITAIAIGQNDEIWVAGEKLVRHLASDGTELGTFDPSGYCRGIAADPATGAVSLLHQPTIGENASLTRLSAQGSVTSTTPTDRAFWEYRMHIDDTGNTWVLPVGYGAPGIVEKFAPDGQLLAIAQVSISPTGLATDTAGNVWCTSGMSNDNSLTKLSAGGVRLGVNNASGSDIARGPDGGLWILKSGALVKLTP